MISKRGERKNMIFNVKHTPLSILDCRDGTGTCYFDWAGLIRLLKGQSHEKTEKYADF